VPELSYLCFSKLFCLCFLLFYPLKLAGFLYLVRRVELSPTVIVLARLELKSFALILMLLLILKNLFKALILVVEKLILN
jgi:hypothetical protein